MIARATTTAEPPTAERHGRRDEAAEHEDAVRAPASGSEITSLRRRSDSETLWTSP